MICSDEPDLTKCGCCGDKLDEDEICNPYEDRDDYGDGTPICFECYHEHYEFTCSLCEEYDDINVQHKMLIVRKAEMGVPPGVYRITGYPYYYSSILGDNGGVNPWDVQKICNLTKEIGRLMDTYYPLGHMCRDCQAEYEGSKGYEKWREQTLHEMRKPTFKTSQGFEVWI